MKAYGSKTWLIPDAFLNSVSKNENLSHEAICVVNTTNTDAQLTLTLFYEDRDPVEGVFSAVCGAKRTHHVRLDRLRSADGAMIARDLPYAILLESSVPVVAQYSRLDTSAGSMALMTTIAYESEE